MTILIINSVTAVLLAYLITKSDQPDTVYDKLKYLTGFISVTLLLFTAVIVNRKIDYILTSVSVALMPAVLPYVVHDVYKNVMYAREQKSIVDLLLLMSKWSAVKNDVVFCLNKADRSDLKQPVKRLINDACNRIGRGMGVSDALSIFEKEAQSEELRYVMMNIRYAYEKGGDLYSIFKSMENQFFKLDEEIYKRKISTSKDRYAVYATILLVLITFYYFVFKNESVKAFYLSTDSGKLYLALFAFLFFIGTITTISAVKQN
ncbi:MAG: type II secretion system F family protein [Clostridia bacterium]